VRLFQGTRLHHPYGDFEGTGESLAMADGGREARVSRYGEKWRTRLFSKKIRYEVRKLNEEKRGIFVVGDCQHSGSWAGLFDDVSERERERERERENKRERESVRGMREMRAK